MQGTALIGKLNTVTGATTAAIVAICITALIIIVSITKISLVGILSIVFKWIIKRIGKIIGKKEASYRRDVAIGKIAEKSRKSKRYRFLNELCIDLGLKKYDITPYELMFFILLTSFIIAIVINRILFVSLLSMIIVYPLTIITVVCWAYTKANLAHDARIEAIIEAENIISSNIKQGVVVAIKGSINLIPKPVRGMFLDFIDNIEQKNYHVRTALLELGNNLGATSERFISKCILFETEEEHGIIGMFQDIVEINNIKLEMRAELKRQFETVKANFITGTVMIFVFLGLVIGIYPNVANFYFNTFIGQLILIIDAIIIVAEFMYITYLRAKEL